MSNQIRVPGYIKYGKWIPLYRTEKRVSQLDVAKSSAGYKFATQNKIDVIGAFGGFAFAVFGVGRSIKYRFTMTGKGRHPVACICLIFQFATRGIQPNNEITIGDIRDEFIRGIQLFYKTILGFKFPFDGSICSIEGIQTHMSPFVHFYR